MKTPISFRVAALCGVLAAAAFLSGCATSAKPWKFRTTDNRNIVIGKSSASNGGWAYDDPHMDKCWVADGFDFNGYDTLYIAPITSPVSINPDEIPDQEIARQYLMSHLIGAIGAKGIFANVAVSESQIKPGAKTLRFKQTIVNYTRGDPLVRHWVGPFTGFPDLRVHGVMMDGDKKVFDYTIRRKGTDVPSLMGIREASNEFLQASDIRSMVLDLTDFITAVAGRYTPE